MNIQTLENSSEYFENLLHLTLMRLTGKPSNSSSKGRSEYLFCSQGLRVGELGGFVRGERGEVASASLQQKHLIETTWWAKGLFGFHGLEHYVAGMVWFKKQVFHGDGHRSWRLVYMVV